MPLFNVLPQEPNWFYWQQYYLDHPDEYPLDGNAPLGDRSGCPGSLAAQQASAQAGEQYQGLFERRGEQSYYLSQIAPSVSVDEVHLVTLHPVVNQQLQDCQTGQLIRLRGRFNRAGNWLLVEAIG